MKGFMSGDHGDQLEAFTAEMSAWLAAGQITAREDISEGLDRLSGTPSRPYRSAWRLSG